METDVRINDDKASERYFKQDCLCLPSTLDCNLADGKMININIH